MSDWHDVENNLAFPPRENITSNNLTDDWKAEKIKRNKYYFFRDGPYSIVQIGFINYDNDLLELSRDEWIEPEVHTDLEILAPCDYDHFVELTEKVKELEKTNKLYKSLSDNGQSAIDTNKRLTEVIEQLRELLKECQKVLSYYGNSNLPCGCSSNIHYDNQTALNLLARINEALNV